MVAAFQDASFSEARSLPVRIDRTSNSPRSKKFRNHCQLGTSPDSCAEPCVLYGKNRDLLPRICPDTSATCFTRCGAVKLLTPRHSHPFAAKCQTINPLSRRQPRWQEHTKVVGLIGTSPTSFAEATKGAIAEASKTVRHMNWFEVV
jgi:hypothetical protein